MNAKILIAGLTALLLAAGVAGGASAERAAVMGVASLDGFSDRLLAEHNRERGRMGVPPLVWNDGLALEAEAWARALAQDGGLRHASQSESRGAGENLWMGTAGYFAPEKMVGAFVEERRFYRHGKFPEVSQTGNWQDVGHYTQVVWRGTREVGCAVARGEGNDFLVCRYWPAGNWMGQSPY